MAETKDTPETHTPGPWRIAPCSDTDETRDIVSGYREEGHKRIAHWIAELDAGIDSDMSEQDQDAAMARMHADACLIAAAPDLLAALKIALAAMEHMGNVLNGMDAIDDEEDAPYFGSFDVVRAALAKAEGA